MPGWLFKKVFKSLSFVKIVVGNQAYSSTHTLYTLLYRYTCLYNVDYLILLKIVLVNVLHIFAFPLVSLLITKERGEEGGAYSGETTYWSMGAYSRKYGIPLSLIFETIVSRGDWLANPANITVENNGAVDYVGSSLTLHNPLFSVHKL